MAVKVSTRYITAMALVEKIRATCKRRLRETTEESTSVFYSPEFSSKEFSISIDHSTGRILVYVYRPLIKLKEEFELKNTDVLVGTRYIELFETSEHFIHLDFDEDNIASEKKTEAPKQKRKKTI